MTYIRRKTTEAKIGLEEWNYPERCMRDGLSLEIKRLS